MCNPKFEKCIAVPEAYIISRGRDIAEIIRLKRELGECHQAAVDK